MMNNWRKIIACKVLLGLAAFLISSCGDWEYEPSDDKHFTSDLRGRWLSNDPSVYSGELIIDYNTIKITGFSQNQTPPAILGGNDNQRPFKDFDPPTGTLSGYSEFSSSSEGTIFIEYRKSFHEIPYEYEYNKTDQTNLIYLKFGGRTEKMKRDREWQGY